MTSFDEFMCELTAEAKAEELKILNDLRAHFGSKRTYQADPKPTKKPKKKGK